MVCQVVAAYLLQILTEKMQMPSGKLMSCGMQEEPVLQNFGGTPLSLLIMHGQDLRQQPKIFVLRFGLFQFKIC